MFKQTLLQDIWRKWKVCKNKELTTERQAHVVRSSGLRTENVVAAIKETVKVIEARATPKPILARAATSPRSAGRSSRMFLNPPIVSLVE